MRVKHKADITVNSGLVAITSNYLSGEEAARGFVSQLFVHGRRLKNEKPCG